MNLITKDRQFYRDLLGIAVPVTLQGLVSMAVNMLDNIMLGSLGEIAISAAALANQFFSFFMILNFGLCGGYMVLMSQFWGKKDTESINRCLAQEQRIALLMGLIFTILAACFSRQILSIFTKEAAVIEAGAEYLRILSIMFLAFAWQQNTFSALRAIGNVRVPLVVMTTAFLINLCFNYILIFGKFGFPALGVRGAAIATVIARLFEAVCAFIIIFFVEKDLNYKPRYLTFWDKGIFKRYLNGGLAVLGSDALLAGGNTALSIIMGHMGAEMVAANSMASVIMQMCTVFNQGFSQGGSILTGHAVGAGHRDKAMSQGKTLLLLSFGVGLVGAVVVQILKAPVLSLYNVSDLTYTYAVQIINSISCMLMFQTVGGLLSKGVLRGGGDTKFLIAADAGFLWLLSIPLGALAGLVFHWPAGLVYICLRADEFVKSIWLTFRLFSGKWIKDLTKA